MSEDWSKLPTLRKETYELLWEDTSGSPVPGKIVPCLLCTKPFIMRLYSGTPDQVCGECYETYKDSARVVCWKCKVTICRLVPKVLDNGFYIQPRNVYHSTACNICDPGLSKSTIIEIDEWQRTVRPKKIILPGSKYAPVVK